MNGLSLFGLFAVTAMVICYALERGCPRFILAFAASRVLGSVYVFEGAWPFGLVEAVWSAIAARRWCVARNTPAKMDGLSH